jgi:hypothetical protein
MAVKSAVGLVVAYALCFVLKAFNLMPDHLTWFGPVVGPAVMFGLIVWIGQAPVVLPRWSPRGARSAGLLVAFA